MEEGMIFRIFLLITFQVLLLSLCTATPFASETLGSKLTVNDETLTDNRTRLMWFRFLAPESEWKSAASSLQKLKANRLTIAGYDDWRLPSKDEIEVLVTYLAQDNVQSRASSKDPNPTWLNVKEGLLKLGFIDQTKGEGSFWTGSSFKYDETFAWYFTLYAKSADDLFEISPKLSFFGLGKRGVIIVRDVR
jgi:hypothetical protein